VFFVASDRRVIWWSRFYRELKSDSSNLRSVYIHIWISELERLDRTMCVCSWEKLSAIWFHFALNNWFAKTFFFDDIHTVSIRTSCSVKSVIMTRSDFIIESFMNNFLMSFTTIWLSQYRMTFFSAKVWIQVLSAHSIACISLKFICNDRIRLKKRTKKAWSRIIFSELDSRVFLEVVIESASFDDSKRISSSWKNESLEKIRSDFSHERELFLDWLRSIFLELWRDIFLELWRNVFFEL
jgi:hypothetical protein